jgi:hypothetical protein
MIAFFKKLVNDTLKNPNTGVWSRKNLTGFTAFVYLIFYCTHGLIEAKEVHEFVVITFASIAVACLGISSWEKANIIQKVTKDENKTDQINADVMPS